MDKGDGYMKPWKEKRQFWMVVSAMALLLAAVPFFSFANSAAPAQAVNIWVYEMPEKGAYLELLIPMEESDRAYTSFNETMDQVRGFTPDSEIASYRDEKGYISYFAHMRGAVASQTERVSDNAVFCSFGDGAIEGGCTHLEYMQEHFGTIKAAVLDREGRILAVSDEASIRPEKDRFGNEKGYLAYGITYNPVTGELQTSFGGSGGGTFAAFAVIFFLLIVHAVFTAAAECGVGWLFRIRPLGKIAVVNLLSNLIFNILLVISEMTGAGSMFGMTYLTRVVIGEILTAACEYLIYCRIFPEEKHARLLVFTAAANLVSLTGGRILLPSGMEMLFFR